MSRLTFRPSQHAVCWQRQVRDHYLSEGCPVPTPLVLKEARVRPISRRLAEQIILKYEWLGTLAPGTQYYYGLFFGLYCAGVTCVSVGNGGANLNAHRPFGLPRLALAYLARGACVHWAPLGSNPKLVSWTCRLLQKATAAKLLLAYADTDAGEIGTIYQACNWVYIGTGETMYQWIAPTGRLYSKKILYDLVRSRGATQLYWHDHLLAQGWQRQHSNPKHRYVMLLDPTDHALRQRIEAMRQPYPKRAPSILADAPTVQAGESGAAPTGALIR